MSKTIKYIIQSSRGPKPVGPYNQAVKVNNLVYLSGVIGVDPKTNQLVTGGVETETKQIFTNMQAILEAAGSDFDKSKSDLGIVNDCVTGYVIAIHVDAVLGPEFKVVKASVFLNDINDFKKVNDIYVQYITKDHPARSAYQVGKLPVGAKVEIEAIALCGEVETQYIRE